MIFVTLPDSDIPDCQVCAEQETRDQAEHPGVIRPQYSECGVRVPVTVCKAGPWWIDNNELRMRHSDPFEIEYFKLPPARDCFIMPREKLENTSQQLLIIASIPDWGLRRLTMGRRGDTRHVRVISVMAGFNPASMPSVLSGPGPWLCKSGPIFMPSRSGLMNHNPTPRSAHTRHNGRARYTSAPFTPASRESIVRVIRETLYK